MKQISFTIPGEPRVQKRHRDRKGGGKYDPSAKDKESFLVQAMAQCKPDKPLTDDLMMIIYCYGTTSLRGDWDNYGKFVSDALAGVYYVNDKQIRFATVGLFRSSAPRTKVSISPLEGAHESPE